jgi:hypothetical protein
MHDDHESTRISLQTQMEQMRREKDTRHANLEDEFERHRVSTNQIITTHESNITSLTTTVLRHESTILGHEQTIRHQEDVHDQHRVATDHKTDLIDQKDTL